MFKKLRNKFILTNMAITTAILGVSFGLIFAVTAISSSRRPPNAPNRPEMSNEWRESVIEEIKNDRNQRLERLGATLMLVAIMTEVLVFIASYYFAEKSIEPVKEAYEKQREFIANASHELKTPIAAARANFEALATTEQPWTNNVDSELDRASKLVNDLLTLARTDGRVAVAAKKEIDLVKLVKKREQLIEARLGDKTIELNLPEKNVVKIAEADLAQIIDILFDNAVKYSKSKIIVSLVGQSLTVANDGKTIPDNKLSRVFDRFYQTDKTAEGSGLGLAIAKAVADKNGWKIRAESDKKMTSFVLDF